MQARHGLLEQERVRIIGEQADGEAPAVAFAHERWSRRQREPFGDPPGQPSGMVSPVRPSPATTASPRPLRTPIAISHSTPAVHVHGHGQPRIISVEA